MSNKRVVITGYGIVSCIGNNKQEVLASLKEVKSGISYCKEYEELGMRSHVHGKPNLNTEEHVDRKFYALWAKELLTIISPCKKPLSILDLINH